MKLDYLLLWSWGLALTVIQLHRAKIGWIGPHWGVDLALVGLIILFLCLISFPFRDQTRFRIHAPILFLFCFLLYADHLSWDQWHEPITPDRLVELTRGNFWQVHLILYIGVPLLFFVGGTLWMGLRNRLFGPFRARLYSLVLVLVVGFWGWAASGWGKLLLADFYLALLE